ncbi:MAG TPA: hypothetical protein DIC36_10595 [Gammaproteobacteria bacterium]|nr:hypothetical protein [Gammaproteobacteria bacterium]
MTGFIGGWLQLAAIISIATVIAACSTPPLGPDEIEVQHTRMGYSCGPEQRAKVNAGWANLKVGMSIQDVDNKIGLPFHKSGSTASAINGGGRYDIDYCGIILEFRNGKLSKNPNKPNAGVGRSYQETVTYREKKPK